MSAVKRSTAKKAVQPAKKKASAETIEKRLDQARKDAIKNMLEQLFESVVGSRASLGSGLTKTGSAFELFSLGKLLQQMHNSGFSISLGGPSQTVLTFAGGPSSADKGKHSYFVAKKDGVVLEAWISVTVTTISSETSGTPIPRTKKACSHYHELDVAIFEPLTAGKAYRPSYKALVLGASCKSFEIQKEQVREALGLRLETAIQSPDRPSRCSWYVDRLPVNPASAMILFGKGERCEDLKHPVDRVGLYVHQLRPWSAKFRVDLRSLGAGRKTVKATV